jgi:hypothetical protein
VCVCVLGRRRNFFAFFSELLHMWRMYVNYCMRFFLLFFRCAGHVHLFDAQAVADWVAHQSQNSDGNSTWSNHQPNNNGSTIPCRELRCYREGARRLPGNVGGACITHTSAFVFVDSGRQALLSAGTAVFGWSLTTNELLWKYQYSEDITSMVTLSEECVLLGSGTGRMAILNGNKLQKASFALQSTPTLVDEWVSYDRGRTQFETPSTPAHAMGIRTMKVLKLASPTAQLRMYRVVWLTECGWILSTRIDESVGKESRIYRCPGCKLHHDTKPIHVVDSNGRPVIVSSKMWFVPVRQICCSTKSLLVWHKEYDATFRALPDHDPRVIGPTTVTMTSKRKSSLQWMTLDMHDEAYRSRTIRLSRQIGAPSSIMVHPNQEWIVIGVQSGGLFLLHSRTQPRRIGQHSYNYSR